MKQNDLHMKKAKETQWEKEFGLPGLYERNAGGEE